MLARVTLLFFFPLLYCIEASGQSRYQFTLEEAIQRAVEKGPDARMSRLRYEQAEWSQRAYRASIYPTLSLSASAPGFVRSLNAIEQDDGSLIFRQQQHTYSSMNLSVNQPVLATGGTIRLMSGLSLVNQSGSGSFSQWQSSPLVVEFSQPLFQFNRLKWQHQLTSLEFETTKRRYMEEMALIPGQITSLFFGAYNAQRQVENSELNVAVNDTVFTLSQKRFELNRISENDVLQSEFQLMNAQTALADAELRYEETLQELRVALALPFDAAVELFPPQSIPDIEVDPDEAIRYARANRSVYLDLVVQSLQAEQNVRRARMDPFAVNVSASYGLNQTSTAFNDLYVNPENRQQFSLSLGFPLIQWGKNKAELKVAKISQQMTNEERVLNEQALDRMVYFQAMRFAMLRDRAEIAAKADSVASRRFEVARSRYESGTIEITDFFNAQREKDSATQNYIETLYNYWSAYFTISQLTLYDFANKISLTY